MFCTQVNAPIVFRGYTRGEGACNAAGAASPELVCATTASATSTSTAESQVALVLVLTERTQADEEALLETIADIRLEFLRRSHVHLFLVVGKAAGPARLAQVEKQVATDPFVSVLSRYDSWALEEALFEYPHKSLLLADESAARCMRWADCASLEDCPVFPFRASSLASFSTAVHGAARAVASQQPCSRAGSKGTARRFRLVDLDGHEVVPLLVSEAAATDKYQQKKIRQLKKTLPSKGVVLALFTDTPADRTALTLGVILMGALGFGVRWTSTGHLKMNELEKIDRQILEPSSDAGAVFAVLESFTRKSKKEVRHAPWIMSSTEIHRTFLRWREHLDSAVCVMYSPHRLAGEQSERSLWEGACAGVPTIVVESFDDRGMYRLFQQLLAVVGNTRALTRAEVEHLKQLRTRL